MTTFNRINYEDIVVVQNDSNVHDKKTTDSQCVLL